MKQRALLLVLIPVAIWWTGCASAPVHIVYPQDEHSGNISRDCITQLQFSFDSSFNPANFAGAIVDGNGVAGTFQPSPAAGGTSTIQFQQPFAPQSGTYGQYNPGFYSHELDYSYTCGSFCVDNTTPVWFVPPHLMFNAQNPASGQPEIPLKQYQNTQAYVAVLSAPTQPIPVTITELPLQNAGLRVSLNGMPVGSPITVTIPTNNNRATFMINGITSGGYFLIEADAPGCQSRRGTGPIKP